MRPADFLADSNSWDSHRILKYFESKDVASIAIFGASGNLGSFLSHSLAKFVEAHSLPISVRAINRANSNFVGRHNIEEFEFDLTSRQVTRLPESDVSFFLSGSAEPLKFTKNSVDTMKIHSMGLLAALEKTSKKFIFGSSSEIYSGVEGSAHEETPGVTLPDHPRGQYIESKRFGEALVRNYCNETPALNYAIARISTIYGPGSKIGDTRVMYKFIQEAILNREITMLDAGNAVRTFLYIADGVRMMTELMCHKNTGTFNVAGIERASIREIAELISLRSGNAKIIEGAQSNQTLIGAPREVIVSTEKIQRVVQMGNLTPLETGIEKTVAWYRNLLGESRLEKK